MRANLFFLALVGTILLTAILLTTLLGTEPSLTNPLVDVSVTDEAQRGDLVITDAPTISGTLTKAPTPGTYILSGAVTVPAGTTVHIPRDVHIFASRDALLIIDGTLSIDGGSWSSNQRHPMERQWHGMIVDKGGRLTARDFIVSDATTAVTCAPGGQTMMERMTFSDNVVGITVLPDSTCTVEHSAIRRGDVGVNIAGGRPTVRDVTFDHLTDGIRIYGNGRPTLSALSLAHITQYLLLTRGEKDIPVSGLTTSSDRPLAERIFDGEDAPTHSTPAGDVPTGRILVSPTAH